MNQPYLTPDDRWDFFGAKSYNEYLSKYLVKGYFNELVPTDIKDAWTTVEYLLAHAYYHWQMYDEGLKKALLIIEMAVKLKAKELNISLKEKPNTKGDIYDKKFSKLIKEVFTEEHHKFLIGDIDRARNIRNFLVHPESNTYMGGMGNIKGNLMLMIRLINNIFEESNTLKTIYENSVDIANTIREFNNQLMVLEYDKPKILIDQILDFKLINNELYLFMNPVRTTIIEAITNHHSLHPEVICITNYKLGANEIKGMSPEGCSIRIYITHKPENLSIHQIYLGEIENCSKTDWEVSVLGLKHNTSWEMVELEYDSLKNLTV